MQKKQKAKAFTLVELLFSMIILGIVGIALTSFMVFSTESMFWSIRKSMITADFRKFTARITQDALNSNGIFLYNNFDPSAVNPVNPADRRAQGLSGDCLILVSLEPIPDINSPRLYQKIVVYYRDNSQNGSVFRRDLTFTPPTEDTSTGIETMISTQRNNLSEPRLMLEETIGNNTSQFFYRVNETTFMVHGEIIHGNNAQEVTNTYNLTISTGG